MTINHQVISILILTLILGCGCQSSDSTDSIKKDSVFNTVTVIDTPRSFVRNYGVKNINRLFAFVGEKISVEPLPHERGSMDNGFKAKYAILKEVYGDFPEDTIEFIAYDHYGIPTFSKFKNVLLYVSADSGIYYHQKYMYNDVYKTEDGRWAGTYAWDDYEHEGNKKTVIKPIRINFKEQVFYPLTIITAQGDTLKRTFPKLFFKRVGDSALAIYGNYIAELFILKRDGYLTAREVFKNGKLNN